MDGFITEHLEAPSQAVIPAGTAISDGFSAIHFTLSCLFLLPLSPSPFFPSMPSVFLH